MTMGVIDGSIPAAARSWMIHFRMAHLLTTRACTLDIPVRNATPSTSALKSWYLVVRGPPIAPIPIPPPLPLSLYS
eukprot:CAMPEP_0175047400 /NCGR_PEP_ID=MMETSP0052_2-20121109/5570_1 /TAXON_ID=51329 ORGANISM="Polytomella parva, Strain SAG 63-3" /NCGR_SAMPLE_ID=MMETSP0052_2 /ASSEMBLY_ACC=CAM_ASM_000194 /LENGTH=75 /DNA_ID=CAMNT_0016311263 /DNA_START=92 /DNA_END=316 /DNA_ORIENTATION=-